MITEIRFLDIARMKKIKPSLDTVIISILDRSEQPQSPKLRGFRSILKLTFEDTYEECKLASAGDWPDSPSEEEHAKFCQGTGEHIPTLHDAQQIYEFLRKHHFDKGSVKLIVHCYGGISRSAAVAQWASLYFWVPLTIQPHQSVDFANRRLLRLLDKVSGRV